MQCIKWARNNTRTNYSQQIKMSSPSTSTDQKDSQTEEKTKMHQVVDRENREENMKRASEGCQDDNMTL